VTNGDKRTKRVARIPTEKNARCQMLTRKCLRWTKFKVISRGRVLRTVAIGLKISVFPMRGLRRSVDERRVVTLIHTFDSSKYPATRPPPSFTSELRDYSRHVGFCQKPGIPAGACRLVVTSLPSARRLVVTSSQFAHAVHVSERGFIFCHGVNTP